VHERLVHYPLTCSRQQVLWCLANTHAVVSSYSVHGMIAHAGSRVRRRTRISYIGVTDAHPWQPPLSVYSPHARLLKMEKAIGTHGEPFSRDPEVLGGELIFAGTRVPLDIVADYRHAGFSIEEFLKNYPSVARWQAEAAWAQSDADLATLIGASALTRGRQRRWQWLRQYVREPEVVHDCPDRESVVGQLAAGEVRPAQKYWGQAVTTVGLLGARWWAISGDPPEYATPIRFCPWWPLISRRQRS
jgi:uncharacterized protein (DUF433 family)